MPVFLTADTPGLPPARSADRNGVVAVGGDLSPERLLTAYQSGIFPWYSEGLPIHWHSPDPRFVLVCDELRVTRSLRKQLRRAPYEITLDRAFGRVIRACAEVPRPGQDGTWITSAMIQAYERLHAMGHAHSIEAWRGDELVGGLYGVIVGRVFCGESMFAWAPDASKIAFVTLVRQLRRWGVPVVDCQVYTEHLERFGALEWPREAFLRVVESLGRRDGPPLDSEGRWHLDPDLDPLEAPDDSDDDDER